MKKFDREKAETVLELFKNNIIHAAIHIKCKDNLKKLTVFNQGNNYLIVLKEGCFDKFYDDDDEITLCLYKTYGDEPIVIDCSKNCDFLYEEFLEAATNLVKAINTTSTPANAFGAQLNNLKKWLV